MEALEEVDQVELVRVNDGDQTVVVRKAGADIEINVRSDREEVKVRLALRTLQGLVDSFDEGRFDAAGAMSALKHSSGLMVHVDEPDTEVSLTIW